MIKLYKFGSYLSDRKVAIDFTSATVRDNWFNIYLVKSYSTHQYIKQLGHQSLQLDLDLTVAEAKTFNYMTVQNAGEAVVYYYFVDKIDYLSDATHRVTCSFDAFMNYYSVINDRHVVSSNNTAISKRHFDRFEESTNDAIVQNIPQAFNYPLIQTTRTFLGSAGKSYLCLRKLSETEPISIWDYFTSSSTTVTVPKSNLIHKYTPGFGLGGRNKPGPAPGDPTFITGCYFVPGGNTFTITIYNEDGTVYDEQLFDTSTIPTGTYAVILSSAVDKITINIRSSVASWNLPTKSTTVITINGTHYKGDLKYNSATNAIFTQDTPVPPIIGTAYNENGTFATAIFNNALLQDKTYSAVRVLPYYLPQTIGLKSATRTLGFGNPNWQYIEAGSTIAYSITNTLGLPAFNTTFTIGLNRIARNNPQLYHSQFKSYIYGFEDQLIERRYERIGRLTVATTTDIIFLNFSANGLSSARFQMVNGYYIPINENDIKKVFAVNNSIATFTNSLNDWTNNYKQIDDAIFNAKNTQIATTTALTTAFTIAAMAAATVATGGAAVPAIAGIAVTAGTITGVGSITKGLVSASQSIEQNRLAYERNKAQMLNSIINSSGSPVDLSINFGDYRFKFYTFSIDDAYLDIVDDVMYYEGLECIERNAIENYVDSRYYFNYLKAVTDFTLVDNVYPYDVAVLNVLINQFNNGVTIMHCLLNGTVDITDWQQTKENWEVTH